MKSNENIVYSCKYHVVWCPKYRRSILDNEIANDLRLLIEAVVEETNSELLAFEIMPDHVHLLVEVDPQFGIHKLVKLIKGRSSRSLRAKYRRIRSRIPTLWTNSYFVATVGGTPLSVIKQYVENQKGK
jgi:putative transposase